MNIDLESAEGELNNIGYVYDGGTISLPTNCDYGIREVYYYNSNSVFIKITGLSKTNTITEWFNFYHDSDWIGWQEQVTSCIK